MSLHGTAQRIADACAAEIGSVVLIVGTGELSDCISGLLTDAGALEVQISAGAEPKSRHGSRFHAVVCLEWPPNGLGAALALCRDRGVAVVALEMPGPADISFYPDAHKRGLSMRFLPRGTSVPAVQVRP